MQTTGSELARAYHDEVVSKLLLARWPRLPYAAARLGSGSDVLGLDDAMSQDHDFGLRLTLLVESDQVRAVDDHLEQSLPERFHGWPTRFGTSWDPKISHQVQVVTADDFTASRLGVPVDRCWDAIDWLAITGQSVLEVTAGPVFVDAVGRISDLRRRLTWYPDDVWQYVVAADWKRVGQELSFVGRTGARGDDLGSTIVTSRLVRTLMHLTFLLERRWPPYAKWLGTCFTSLSAAAAVAPALIAAQAATSWVERQTAVQSAVEAVHQVQRRTGLPTGPDVVEPFFGRPFAAVKASVIDLLLADVEDPLVQRLPAGLGSVEQWVDNVDVLVVPERRVALAQGLRVVLVEGGGVLDTRVTSAGAITCSGD